MTEPVSTELKAEDFLDPAQSPYISCVLPTGFVYEDEVIKECFIREMTGEEEDIISARKASLTQRFQRVMERCVLQMGSLKPEHPEWGKLIRGLTMTDRLFLLIQIRMASLGNEMSFQIECPHCRTKSNQSVDLNEIEFGSGDPKVLTWNGVFPRSKKAYVYRAATGHNEEKAAKIEGDDVLSQLILSRLESLDGKPPTLNEVKKLPMMDRQFLRSQIQKTEAKVDDKVQIDCPSCGKEFETELDINSPNFFFPSDQ